MGPCNFRRFVVTVALVTAGATAASAQTPDAPPGSEIESLRREIEVLRQQYDARLTALEAQVAQLQAELRRGAPLEAAAGQQAPAPADAEPQADDQEARAALESELAAALASTDQPETPAAPAGGQQRFMGGERTLQELNPEISVTADMFGTVADRTGDPESNQFRLSEFELAAQAPLDPFSVAKAFVVEEEGEVNVEEAYIDWTSLPGGLGLKVGRFRNDFGKINRYHQHALPQADRPLVHQAIFGEEGLSGLGASVSWLTPRFLGDYNEVWFQVTNDDNDVAFSGRGFDDPVFLAHETNYWDITNASYVEFGLSAATGVNDPLGLHRTQVYGVDWNYRWSPPAEALYKDVEVRGEFLWNRREEAGGLFDTKGAYTYANYKLNRQWFAGARADWTEVPGEPGASLWGISPYLEWWQSEWARIRFQYSHNSRRLDDPSGENRLYFQVTWAIGPHKHEQY